MTVHAVRLFIAHAGLGALFVLILIEEAGVWLPLPGDLLIVYFGYRAAHAHHPLARAALVLLVVTAAVVCGSMILYAIARRFRWLVRRLGPIFHLHEERQAKIEHWLQRHGPLVVIPGRLIPGLRIPTTAVCGSLGLPPAVFLPSVAVAGLLWATIYLILGAAGSSVLATGRALLPDSSGDVLLWLLLLCAAAVVLVQTHPWHPRGRD